METNMKRTTFTRSLIGCTRSNLPASLYLKGEKDGTEIWGSEDWDSREYLLRFNKNDVVTDAEMREI